MIFGEESDEERTPARQQRPTTAPPTRSAGGGSSGGAAAAASPQGRSSTSSPGRNASFSYGGNSVRGGKTGVIEFKGKKYTNGLVDGRHVSYYFLGGDSTPFHELIKQGVVNHNTEFTMEIEHCVNCDKHQMTMRHSANTYADAATALDGAVREGVAQLFPINVFINSKRKKGFPRLGAFEVSLMWAYSKMKYEVLLFSKLETRRFPHIGQLAQFIRDALVVVRQVETFRIIVRNAIDGTPVPRAWIVVTNEETQHLLQETHVSKNGTFDCKRVPFGTYRIEVFTNAPESGATGPTTRAMVTVNGTSPQNICISMPPKLTSTQILVSLSWASDPASMSLYVRTPASLVGPTVSSSDAASCRIVYAEATENGSGFGPATVLVDRSVAGAYHVYVQPSKSYAVSNAQLIVANASGILESFTVPRSEIEMDTIWWDVVVFRLDKEGNLLGGLSEIQRITMEEPGYGLMQVMVMDLLGRPVSGAQVILNDQAELGDSKGFGKTDDSGFFRAQLPHNAYELLASAPDEGSDLISAPTAAVLRMDEEIVCGFAPLVPRPKEQEMRIVLTWVGLNYGDEPKLAAEMHGAYIRSGQTTPANLEVPFIIVSSSHVSSLMLRGPLRNPCHIYAKGLANQPLDHLCLQVTIYTEAEPIVFRPRPQASNGDYWDICVIHDISEIEELNEVVKPCPHRGRHVSLAAINANDGIGIDGATALVRLASDKEDPGVNMISTGSGQMHSFLPFGEYVAEVTCQGFLPETRPIKVDINHKKVGEVTRFAVGMIEENMITIKQGRLVLTWGNIAANLRIQLWSQEGTCSVDNPNRGTIRLEQLPHDDMCGPAVISLRQPLSGKFKLQVVNTSYKTMGSMVEMQPMVTMYSSKGAMEGGVWNLTLDPPKASSVSGEVEIWTVCGIDIEEYAKLDADSVIFTPINTIALEDSAH